MRARLALAFALFALVLTSLGGAVRVHALVEAEREHETTILRQTARLLATVVEDLRGRDQDVTTSDLAALVPDQTELTVTSADLAAVIVTHPDFDDGSGDGELEVEETVGSTRVVLVQDADVVGSVVRQVRGPLFWLLVLLVLFAGCVGFVIATALARPFHRLAESAAALGRGRFDFEAPKSSIPEVVLIASSLEKSAQQLEHSLRSDREFFHHASHVLRTPLTGMRLELEELSLRTDLTAESRQLAAQSLADAERLDETVTELLDFARSRRLVSGAEVTLLKLGSSITQRWRNQLPDSREVRTYVDSGPGFALTPGPVEQLLDSVLRDVVAHGTGPVMLRLVGQEEHVRVTVICEPGPDPVEEWPSGPGTQMIAEVLGGRCTGDLASGELEILLPRR